MAKRILLVDDEAELTDPLTQVLSREGYEVDVADNGIAGDGVGAAKRVRSDRSRLDVALQIGDRDLSRIAIAHKKQRQSCFSLLKIRLTIA